MILNLPHFQAKNSLYDAIQGLQYGSTFSINKIKENESFENDEFEYKKHFFDRSFFQAQEMYYTVSLAKELSKVALPALTLNPWGLIASLAIPFALNAMLTSSQYAFNIKKKAYFAKPKEMPGTITLTIAKIAEKIGNQVERPTIKYVLLSIHNSLGKILQISSLIFSAFLTVYGKISMGITSLACISIQLLAEDKDISNDIPDIRKKLINSYTYISNIASLLLFDSKKILMFLKIK